MPEKQPDSSNLNPYAVSTDSEPNPFEEPIRPRPPGPVAIFFSVVLGLAIATATFGVTFFFTCLGISNTSMGGEAEAFIVFGTSFLTAVGAFVFTVWGLLKLGKLFRS